MSHRLRFAPSPTGYLHVGGARTALFNWLFVKHYGGQFLLRIEDTDKARSTDESTRAIFEGLEWLGLTWDEEVVYQGANLSRHRADVDTLVAGGKAYRCFCTPQELDEQRAAATARGEAFKYDRRCDRLDAGEVQRRVAAAMPFSVRFRVPEGETAWDDIVHGRIAFPNRDIGEGDFIILRSDGTPIYNLAVVSDDIAMRITLVMRGDDHISNTPKQILIYEALGAATPRFAHLPMIHGGDGRKLSKRHGATAVGDYQHLGILPQAMLNFLALLGWSPGNDIEVMTVPRMIELFSTEGLLRKAAVFDTKKLEWMNGQHLAMMAAADLAKIVTPLVVAQGAADAATLASIEDRYLAALDLLKVRSRTTDEIARQVTPYVSRRIVYDPEAVAKGWKDRVASAELLGAVRDTLAPATSWDHASLEEALKQLAERRGLSAGKLYQPMRVALTGQTVSPGIFELMGAMGRDLTLERLTDAHAWLSNNVTQDI
jgi:glutamyl-tRNA synthetase